MRLSYTLFIFYMINIAYLCKTDVIVIQTIFMKKITVLFAVMIMTILIGAGNQSMAQDIKNSSDEVKIKTSAVCGMCKDRIETSLSTEKGVKSVSVDTDTKIATVSYNPEKTDPSKICTAISKIGYDADNVKADPEAYAKLPGCCKKSD